MTDYSLDTLDKIKSISVKRNGLIKPDSEIHVESTVSFEPKSALGSIQLKGVQGTVKLGNKDKLAIWKPVTQIPEGLHTFEIGELVFADGTKQESIIQIPLFVLDSKAQISSDLTVHHVSRVEINGTKIKRIPLGSTRGNYIEMIKAFDNVGKRIDLAYDKKGNRVDIKRINEDHNKKYVEKYGKIHESLYEELNKKKREKDLMSVAIWLDIKQRDSKLKDKKRQKSEYKKLRKDIQAKGIGFTNKIKEKFKIETVRIDSSAPVVYTLLTKSQISYLAKDKDVSRIFLYEPEGIDDLQNSINIAYSNNVHVYGVTGSNVRAAVWERGPDIDTDLVISAVYDTSSNADTSSHARLTTAIIRNNELNQPHGHAPSCLIHSANNYGTEALDWAIDMGCTVISQSFHRDSEQTSDTLSFDDILKDWLILHPPYPTIVQAAGNGNTDEFVNHKGYNSLAIANHDDTASALSSTSVFRNPSTLHGDRELPELSANGTVVSAVGVTDSGTSFAAPAVAGIAALIQEADSVLKDWPEACRAILLAGANRSVTGDTWWNDVLSGIDAKDGAGAVNAYQSYAITENRVVRNGIAERGWHAGTLSSRDFGSDGMSTFTYRVRTPVSGWSPFARVKIALAWDSEVRLSVFPPLLSSHLTLDLDLWVYDVNNNLVGVSASLDNSYEIAEFPVRANTTYTIKIGRWSGSNDTWYGIAWNAYGFIVADPGLNVSM
jgi:hypothetical protein